MKNRFVYAFQRYALFRFIVLILFFIVLGSLISYLKSINKAVPVIKNIYPRIFEDGDMITIQGVNFGDEAEDSFLKIDNTVIPSTLCKEWKDEKIVISSGIAQDGGLLFVIAKNTYSEPSFFSSKSEIPIVKTTSISLAEPNIGAISKNNGRVGELIKIYGENFGTVREDSQVIFVKGNDRTFDFLLDEVNLENVSCCSSFDFDFDFWSDEEIHVHIPDGAVSGSIVVKTKNGVSNLIPFNVKNDIGQKEISNKKNYVILMQTEISHVDGEKGNSLFLLSPSPDESFSQSGKKTILIEPEPLVENHNGVSVHKIDDVKKEDILKLKHQYKISSYEINVSLASRGSEQNIFNEKLYNQYTRPTALLPSTNETIKKYATSIVRLEKNRWQKAKRIYEHIIGNFEITKEEIADRTQDVLSFLESKKGSAYDASLLFATLGRSVGIPTTIIAGVAIDKANKTYLHWWNAFYIEGLGWVPVDIGMALGFPFRSEMGDLDSYYFGNIDANRISFSHEQREILQMTSNSKTYAHERSFALQTFWEEAVGINSYTSFWQTPQIISVDSDR